MEALEIINIYTKSIKQVLDVPSESHFVDDNQINVYISTASCLPHNKHITHAIL
jgi:hypothetical protein